MLHLSQLLLASLVSLGFQDLPTPPPVRPRDPWVFRSVLDGHPRIVTVALHQDLWVAYDTETCALYKVWKGGVRFQGAVYTSVHGDQPLSFGPTYQVGVGGPVWSAEVQGRPVDVRVQWRGYAIQDGRVHLEFDLTLPDGRFVRMREIPEYWPAETVFPLEDLLRRGLAHGMPVLVRSYRPEVIPDGVVILNKVRTEIAGVRARDVYPQFLNLRDKIVKEPQADGTLREYVISYVPLSNAEHAHHVNLGVTYDFVEDPPPAEPLPGTPAPKDPKPAGTPPGSERKDG